MITVDESLQKDCVIFSCARSFTIDAANLVPMVAANRYRLNRSHTRFGLNQLHLYAFAVLETDENRLCISRLTSVIRRVQRAAYHTFRYAL